MEADGVSSQSPPWITRDGGPIYGGEPYTFPHEGSLPNSQCVFHGQGSSAVQHPDGSVDASIKITFRTPEFITQLWTSPQYATTPNIRWVWLLGYNGTLWGWDLKGTVGIRPSDTTPPQISGVSPSPSSGTAVVAFKTDELSDSKVFYGTSPGYGSQSYSSAPETSHGLALGGIVANTLYYFRIESKDWAGNTSSATGSFLAQGPNEGVRIVRSSPGPSAGYPLPPDGTACSIEIISDTFDPVKQQWNTVYSPKYVKTIKEADAIRLADNVARLSGKVTLTINPSYPRLDFRNRWQPQFVFTRRFEGSPPGIYHNSQLVDTYASSTTVASQIIDLNIQVSMLPASNFGRFHSNVLGQVRSPFCEQNYPDWYPSGTVFTTTTGAVAKFVDVYRPEIPTYSPSTPNPPFYLGRDAFNLPIQTNGPYRSYALLTSGARNGATSTPTWTILYGTQFGRLECVGNPSSTTCQDIKFQSLQGSTGCLAYDVVLKANYGGLDSKEMHIFINRPYGTQAFELLGSWPWYTFFDGDRLNGWKAEIGYQVKGLCLSDPFMAGYSVEESFDSGSLAHEATGENWSAPWLVAVTTGGFSLAPSDNFFFDSVNFHPFACGFASCVPSVTPYSPFSAAPPLTGQAVFSLPQFISIAPPRTPASMTPSSLGVRVQNHRLRFYQDGAVHEEIVNPAIPVQ